VDSDKSSVDVKKAKRSVTRRSCIVVDSQQWSSGAGRGGGELMAAAGKFARH
jgi:hypothetical protein